MGLLLKAIHPPFNKNYTRSPYLNHTQTIHLMARAKKPQLPVLAPNPPVVNDIENPPPSTVNTHTTATKLNIPEAKAPLASSTNENWQLPVAMGQGFSTFIDHDTELDGQGYPLLPNRSTTYVRPVGAEIMNFESVGFSNTNNVASRTKGQWKVIHVTCLGVMLCDWEECDYTGLHQPAEIKSRSCWSGNLVVWELLGMHRKNLPPALFWNKVPL
ncbi:hypothetical protein PSHT_01073 [Puccinia striiformis]|uniref:Uncharacterized protein n=1 Tax=Puccinia striiformis TaxID=27350 RepID=A0A2S4WLH5_9BASI|nr:hypothetical protein PSHT_01073 [Puccinia striiformis]